VVKQGALLKGYVALDTAIVLRYGSVAPGDTVARRIEPGASSSLSVRLVGDSGSVTLWITGAVAPPRIVLTRPGRAVMLERGDSGSARVRVEGIACDGHFPIASLSINGVAQPVSGGELCEPFLVHPEVPWGHSTITVEARNARGRRAMHVQSLLRSAEFLPVALHPDSAITTATARCP
jgi:hypothetical protein